MLKIGVMLAGCGVFDGSEIHEAVLTLLALAEHQAEAVCIAPDMEQVHVINHLTGEPAKEKRNVLVESARIARGKIKNAQEVRGAGLDGIIFPGGYGAVKNLCGFAFDGAACDVHPEVARVAREIHEAGKPIGAICISPALMACIFKNSKMTLTIGNDRETAAAIQSLGHTHQDRAVDDICVDASQRMVTTPAYMLAQNIFEASQGIRRLTAEVLRMAGSR